MIRNYQNKYKYAKKISKKSQILIIDHLQNRNLKNIYIIAQFKNIMQIELQKAMTRSVSFNQNNAC